MPSPIFTAGKRGRSRAKGVGSTENDRLDGLVHTIGWERPALLQKARASPERTVLFLLSDAQSCSCSRTRREFAYNKLEKALNPEQTALPRGCEATRLNPFVEMGDTLYPNTSALPAGLWPDIQSDFHSWTRYVRFAKLLVFFVVVLAHVGLLWYDCDSCAWQRTLMVFYSISLTLLLGMVVVFFAAYYRFCRAFTARWNDQLVGHGFNIEVGWVRTYKAEFGPVGDRNLHYMVLKRQPTQTKPVAELVAHGNEVVGGEIRVVEGISSPIGEVAV